ncbi:MAG: hypothetical protein JWM35_803 [Verrucomicrobia bacterium]|nr:hypothetical protein [Verrucomicrobiota bacterium]
MSYIFTRNAAHDLFGIQDRIARDRPKIAIQ